MTLDEAIAHAEDVADRCDTSCGKEHRQLADWLKELRDLKRQHVGNAAAMREALEELVNHHCRNCPDDTQYGCGVNIGGLLGFKCSLLKQARAALSAPERNCDKYKTPEESIRMFESYIRESGKLGFINPFTEVVKWLFAPAAERKGEGDGR